MLQFSGKEYSTLDKPELSRRTFRCDLWRGACDGVLSAGIQTFALFIAIRYYNAGEWSKSLIASSPFIGMFLSLLFVHYVSGSGLRKAICGAIPAFITAISLILAAWAGSSFLFTLFIILGYTCRSSLLPFLTAIYNDNYPASKRGTYFAIPLLLTVGIASIFALLGSSLLEAKLENFTWLFTGLGLMGLVKALAIYKMPSNAIEGAGHDNPFGNLKYVFQDKSFGYVLLTWFIMGFANLWILPLRVDYVTSATYGIEGSPFLVALLITAIPETTRLIFIPVWARLFDRINFIVLRMMLNTLFAIGVALFFITRDPVIIGLGSGFIGLAFAGGSIAWSLWVTKYAPEGKTAAYMSVHAFLTGVRGTIGPIIGYWTVARIGTVYIGLLSAGMIILATLMLIPEIRHGRGKAVSSPLA
ncbi:MAG: MFS transporter [Nitrospinota bacterium]|nr:MFS transporter [Nitrospinota bacterium]